MVKGYSLQEWVLFFQICHNIVQGSLVQWCWPDGESSLSQPQFVLELFQLMKQEAQKQINKQAEQAQKNGK